MTAFVSLKLVKVLVVQAGGPTVGLLGSLSRYGLRVVVGASATAALEIATKVDLRTIVADYHLPDRSGVWLLEQFRRTHPTVQRVLTANEPRIDLERLVLHGVCHAAVRRPYEPRQIIDIIAGVPQQAHLDDTPIISVGPRSPAAPR